MPHKFIGSSFYIYEISKHQENFKANCDIISTLRVRAPISACSHVYTPISKCFRRHTRLLFTIQSEKKQIHLFIVHGQRRVDDSILFY